MDWKATAKKHWFLIGLFVVVGLAAAYPSLGKKNGIIRAEYTISYVAVGIIFLLSGLGLKTRALGEAIIYWKLILVVQATSLCLIPAFTYALYRLLLLTSFDRALLHGLIIAMCCPTTISSNVLMTKSAKGNEAAALVNAVLGSILGVFVSPPLILFLLDAETGGGAGSFTNIFTNLGITVIAPLMLGQLLRFMFPNLQASLQEYVNLGYLNSSMLLLLVWSVFCDTFSSGVFSSVAVGYVIAMVFICLGLYCLFSGAAFGISRISWFGFTKLDSIAIVYCAGTKTMALGVPLINVIFADDPLKGVYTLPLLVYHAEQLFGGAAMVGWFQSWLDGYEDTEVGLSVVALRDCPSGSESNLSRVSM